MQLLRTASGEFERIVGLLPSYAWGRPTPCDISVAEVVDHVVAGNRFSALLISGASREHALAALSGYPRYPTPLDAVRDSARAQCEAFEAADPEVPVATPQGEVTTQTFCWFRIGDLVVHAWDVARGARLDETLDAEVVAGLWELTEPNIAWMRSLGAYGDGASADLPTSVTLQQRLLDAYGRRPWISAP